MAQYGIKDTSTVQKLCALQLPALNDWSATDCAAMTACTSADYWINCADCTASNCAASDCAATAGAAIGSAVTDCAASR